MNLIQKEESFFIAKERIRAKDYGCGAAGIARKAQHKKWQRVSHIAPAIIPYKPMPSPLIVDMKV